MTFMVLRKYGRLIKNLCHWIVLWWVVPLAVMVIGLPIMILMSKSILDPIGEVVNAMVEVECGHMGT
ncbi:hypothetical protein [Mycobacterium lepromatosis]|uniref:hypothetical protein n=1 Tax=Mycobacterium lepromatosis TaxID=480418 RepID=UPI000B32E5EF|nr:hypothetical protein [Mycobacterium lepromatosis]